MVILSMKNFNVLLVSQIPLSQIPLSQKVFFLKDHRLKQQYIVFPKPCSNFLAKWEKQPKKTQKFKKLFYIKSLQKSLRKRAKGQKKGYKSLKMQKSTKILTLQKNVFRAIYPLKLFEHFDNFSLENEKSQLKTFRHFGYNYDRDLIHLPIFVGFQIESHPLKIVLLFTCLFLFFDASFFTFVLKAKKNQDCRARDPELIFFKPLKDFFNRQMKKFNFDFSIVKKESTKYLSDEYLYRIALMHKQDFYKYMEPRHYFRNPQPPLGQIFVCAIYPGTTTVQELFDFFLLVEGISIAGLPLTENTEFWYFPATTLTNFREWSRILPSDPAPEGGWIARLE